MNLATLNRQQNELRLKILNGSHDERLKIVIPGVEIAVQGLSRVFEILSSHAENLYVPNFGFPNGFHHFDGFNGLQYVQIQESRGEIQLLDIGLVDYDNQKRWILPFLRVGIGYEVRDLMPSEGFEFKPNCKPVVSAGFKGGSDYYYLGKQFANQLAFEINAFEGFDNMRGDKFNRYMEDGSKQAVEDFLKLLGAPFNIAEGMQKPERWMEEDVSTVKSLQQFADGYSLEPIVT